MASAVPGAIARAVVVLALHDLFFAEGTPCPLSVTCAMYSGLCIHVPCSTRQLAGLDRLMRGDALANWASSVSNEEAATVVAQIG